MIGVSLNTLEDTAYIIVYHAFIRSWPSGLALLDHVIASLLGKDACSFLAFDGAHALNTNRGIYSKLIDQRVLGAELLLGQPRRLHWWLQHLLFQKLFNAVASYFASCHG